MKALLKKILPWHWRQTLSWARFYHAKRKPPFEGVYARFDEVPRASGWRAELWTETSRLHAERERAKIGVPIPESSQPSKALLPLLAAATMPADRPLRILDFGGAGGLDYAHLLAALGGNTVDVRYHVVDMPESCAAGRAVWADDPRVVFTPELPEAGTPFDIIYAFTAVHTVEDTRGLLAAFAGYHPRFMLFCKTSMHEGPSFVRKQVNMGPEMENPQWALGFSTFVALLGELGYDLTYRGYGEDVYNVDNYPPAWRAGRTTNLLFRRRAGADA
jgi:putative methyltransferase (TIGR04325 family)